MRDVEPQLLTIAVASRRAGTSPDTIARAIARRDLAAVKLGRRTMIPTAAFEAWLGSLPTATLQDRQPRRPAIRNGHAARQSSEAVA